jgi:hypothetical protein
MVYLYSHKIQRSAVVSTNELKQFLPCADSRRLTYFLVLPNAGNPNRLSGVRMIPYKIGPFYCQASDGTSERGSWPSFHGLPANHILFGTTKSPRSALAAWHVLWSS